MGNVETAVRTLRSRGHVLLREVFPAGAIDKITCEVTRFFDHFECVGGSEAERNLYDAFGNLSLDSMRDAGFPLSGLFPMISACLGGLLAEHFGGPVCVPCNHVLGRRYRPPYGNVVPFHQDITVIDPRASVTSWIPLTDCGEDAPGLEVVDTLIEAPIERVTGDYSIAADAIKWPTVRPSFLAGDAMLFLNTTPHRSHVAPGMTAMRQSLEIRYMPQRLAFETEAGNLVAL